MTTAHQLDGVATLAVVDDERQSSGQSRGLASRLVTPTDASWLGFVRIAFGMIMVWEVWRYFDNGWIARYYQEPNFFFTYGPFDFLRPWAGTGMVLHFLALGAAGLLVAAGIYYRVAASALFVLFTYVFLLDKANYLNHFYLVSLVAFLLTYLPAHRSMSLDVLRRPGLSRATVPVWMLWLVRFQIGVPYFFGGLAKLNADWLGGEPLRMWLARKTEVPFIGQFFLEEPVVRAMAYGSLLFDLAVVPLLLYRRTRPWAFALAMMFHLLNARLFSLGIFPWLMILLTTVFFPPDWPKRLFEELRSRRRYRLVLAAVVGFAIGTVATENLSLVHGLVVAIGSAALALDVMTAGSPKTSAGDLGAARRRVPLLFLGIWIAVQVLVPLRNLAIPGNVHWTEEGHRFSWHMMVRSKDSDVRFVVFNPPTGSSWEVDPADWLTSRQVDELAGHPDMILQFAHHLEDRWQEAGHEDIEVRALTSASLNGRPEQPLVDPTIDLTRHSRWALPPAPWIVPLEATGSRPD